MCDVLSGGRTIGRRANIVLVAEGATDVHGQPVTVADVKQALEERLGEDARVTILGHVQRGGAPSAFDRYMGTVVGYAAVRQLLERPDDEPQLIGIQGHRVVSSPLMECVATTQSIADVIAGGDSEKAMQMRGGSFTRSHELLRSIVRARPRRIETGQRPLRLAVVHGGGPVPGMNTAVRIALRVAMDRGHTLLGVRDGFHGLLDSTIDEMGWMSVSGWVSEPGAELGTHDLVPDREQVAHISRQLAIHHVRRAADDRRLGGVRSGVGAESRQRRGRAAVADRVRAGVGEQQPAGDRHEHRRRQRPQQHRQRRRQDQGSGDGQPDRRRRGDGQGVRLPRPGEWHGDRCRTDLRARGGICRCGACRTTLPRCSTGSSAASGAASSCAAAIPTPSTPPT